MAWKEWVTGTSTEYIYGADLNGNFDYLSSLLASGITGGNFAVGAVNNGNFIAADVVGERHLNWASTTDGPRVLQIGKKTDAAYQMLYLQGTSLITSANVTYTDITITFTNGVGCTGGEAFISVPHVKAWVYAYGASTAGPHQVTVYTCGTTTAGVRLDMYDTETIAANQTIYWELIGRI